MPKVTGAEAAVSIAPVVALLPTGLEDSRFLKWNGGLQN